MATLNLNTDNEIIVTFHIGRGGRFYNAGHKSFYGEMNLQEVISEQSTYLFEHRRDANGRFCKPYYACADGSEAVSTKYFDSLTGYLEFDGEYNTYISKYVSDCSDEELDLIRESDNFKSFSLKEYIKEEEEEEEEEE